MTFFYIMILQFYFNKKHKMTENTNQLMQQYQQLLQFTKNSIRTIEVELKRVKLTLDQLTSLDPNNPNSLSAYFEEVKSLTPENLEHSNEDGVETIEGIFDGMYMIGADQKKYPVPLNYSSKTKLVPGDILKLKIMTDGKFIYKLIKPVERKHVRAILSKTDENKFTANTDDGKIYFLNQAAVSFYLGKPGDELYILINENGEGSFAAIEAIIKQ